MYSNVFPTHWRYRAKSALEITTVPRQSFGWNESDGTSLRFSSRKRWTWWSVSLISPKGDTLPGSSPRYFIILSGEAKTVPIHCSRSGIKHIRDGEVPEFNFVQVFSPVIVHRILKEEVIQKTFKAVCVLLSYRSPILF